jgi:hypothetical protein
MLLLGACAVPPYEPARERLPVALPEDAFERVRDVVAVEYPALVEADRERFRLRTDWCNKIDRGTAAQTRAALWLEDFELCAVVEVRYLRGGGFGPPDWSEVQAQPFWERELLARAVSALEIEADLR